MNDKAKVEETKETPAPEGNVNVGETIKLGGKPEAAATDKEAPAENGAPVQSAPTSVRKRIGSARVKTARDRIAAGTASDADRDLIKSDEESRRRPVGAESPPSSENAKGKFGTGTGGAWRANYGGNLGGREMVCTELAQYVHAGTHKLAKYIKDNGGSPIIDPDDDKAGERWYNILVLAADEVLPPNVTAAPHLIAAIGIGTLTGQGALTAYKLRKAKKLETTAGEDAVKKALPATEAIKESAAVGEVKPAETVVKTPTPVSKRDKI